MLKKALTAFILPFLFLLSSSDAGSANPVAQKQTIPDNPNEATGILQKMIVESGTATMKLDLNRLNGISVAPQKQEQMRFDIAANSFFSILVFNDLLRGPEQGSMALIPQDSSPAGLNQRARGVRRILQAAHNRKTSFRRTIRSRRPGRKNGLRLFQY